MTVFVRRARGFTLIELIITIVILGILAAMAIPRFYDSLSDAQQATSRGLKGVMKASVGIAHATWLAAGANSAGSTTITLDQTGVSVNSLGWPDAGTGTNDVVAADCVNLWNALLSNPPPVTTTTCSSTEVLCYQITVFGSPKCRWVMYTNGVATNRMIGYRTDTGVVSNG